MLPRTEYERNLMASSGDAYVVKTLVLKKVNVVVFALGILVWKDLVYAFPEVIYQIKLIMKIHLVIQIRRQTILKGESLEGLTKTKPRLQIC